MYFNNNLVTDNISWQSVELVEDTEVSGENNRPDLSLVTDKRLLHYFIEYAPAITCNKTKEFKVP
jgi:hypothetical protein